MEMTNDKITIREGDVEVTYTAVVADETRTERIEEAAQSFIQMLVEASAFSVSEFSENNARAVDY